MFLPFAFAIAAILASARMTVGVTHTAGIAWLLAMLAPDWLARRVGSLTIDLRLVTLIVLIPLLVSGNRWIRGFTWVDGWVAALASVGIFSLSQANLLGPSEFLVIVSTWIVPYVFGRLVITSRGDLDRLLPYACVACLILSTWSMVESTTRVNPLNLIAERGGSWQSEQDLRFNLRRAEGPVGHPIYFGMNLAMLLPWALEGARRAWLKRLPRLFLITPIACVAGVFFTLSRGPLLVVACVAVSAFFFCFPHLRLALTVLLVAVALALIVAWPLVVNALENFSGERSHNIKINIDGEEYEYSGTKHRMLLYRVYGTALSQAGLLGYGKWNAKLEHALFVEPHLRSRFKSIDNHYVLLVLNWGLLGLTLFLGLCLAAASGSASLACWCSADHRLLLGAMCGAITGIMILLLTVWFSTGFGFSWLCSLGVLSSSQIAYRFDRHGSRGPLATGSAQSLTSPLAR